MAACEGRPTAPTNDLAAVMAHAGHGMAAARGDVSPAALAGIRRATARFHTTAQAEKEGYGAFGGCFDNPGAGAMGYHWSNPVVIADSAIDAERPELLVYERAANGRMHLVALEYIVFVDDWHGAGHVGNPSLFGEDFHINPTLLDRPFYLLHVWAWKDNPAGTLTDWNPDVVCR
jgi:hypothetical protein